MPEDVGGMPFPDGEEPEDDRGLPDEELDSVVFDEAFVGAAVAHEPTAVERLLSAAQARARAAETGTSRARPKSGRHDNGYGGQGWYDPLRGDDLDDPGAGTGAPGYRHGFTGRPRGAPVRWYRPVAWVLALAMGIGMVALVLSALYRGSATDSRPDPVTPPASTGLEQGGGSAGPSVPVGCSRPEVPVLPGCP